MQKLICRALGYVSFAICGDSNKGPSQTETELQVNIIGNGDVGDLRYTFVSTNTPTHQSERTLDFAIMEKRSNYLPKF